MSHDLTGQKFGKLTALYLIPGSQGKSRQWMVRCDCGETRAINTGALRAGQRTGCSCSRGGPKHGMHKSRLYSIHSGIKARCLNKKHSHYAQYGGRGISICKEWENDFLAFKKWADESGYRDDLQIDRICNDMGYFPENCRWVDAKTNMNNRSVSKRYDFFGSPLTVTEAAERYNISEGCMRQRLKKMTPNEAASLPVGRKSPSGFSKRMQYRSDSRCAGL